MKSLVLVAAFFGLATLAGCQNGGSATSTYAGSIDRGGVAKIAPTTKRVKVGKVRRVRANGDIYYVNKYKRVRIRSASSSYAPKRRVKKKTVFSKVLKKSTKSKRRVAKVKHNRTPKGRASSPKNLDKLIAKHAKANGVPLKLARAVVQIESAGRVNARGAAGEVGLMQLMPRTARGIGYKGKMKNLYNPDTNLAYGMKYLGEAYRRGGKTTCGAILKYNAGHYAKRWNPTSRKYCKRAKKIMRKG